jgi:hypothetical protein
MLRASFYLTLFLLTGWTVNAQAACVSDGYCDRPIKMGVSISNTPSLPYIYAGTAGMRVRALGNPNIKFILSNSHVLGAVGPTLCPGTADGWPLPATWALQPGTLDIGSDPGNNPAYFAGLDFRYTTINYGLGSSNTVDAAIAYTTTAYASSEILGIGQPNPVLGQPTVGMQLTKSGRTTGVTTGSVTAVNSTLFINYGAGCGLARFSGQAVTTAGLGDSGDSGSVVLEQGTNTPVGLYFAGSATTGIMNPILDVYRALGVFVDSDTAPAAAISEADIDKQAKALPKDPRVERLKQIQARHESRILAVSGVVGFGIGLAEDGKTLGLVVFCKKLTNTLRAQLPATIEGVPVRLFESGQFVAQ